MKKVCELKVDGQDDRRKLCAILADYGYAVHVEHRKENYYSDAEILVIVHEQESESC